MNRKANISEFLKLADQLPVIDVRSPAEYQKGHIPFGHNIPLFENEERAKIGTIYQHEGSEKAIRKGYEIALPKTISLVESVKRLAENKTILIYCWRGGMRSAAMANLFDQSGYDCIVAEGGYQAYRRYIRQQLSVNANIILLGGMTGSGKTELLEQLRNKGEQVLDLEKLAHHKGSVFGSIGEDNQPSNEQFENDLFNEWQKFDTKKTIWIEDESISLGKIFIPDPLWNQMKSSPLILIERPVRERINEIINKYTGINDQLINAGILKLKRRLGSEKADLAMKALDKNNYYKTAEILLHYYDKAYLHSVVKRKGIQITTIQASHSDDRNLACEVIKKACGFNSRGSID